MDTEPGTARTMARDLNGTIVAALEELKATVGLLRQADDPGSPLEPAPGLAQLPGLATSFRAAGLTVTITTEGEPQPLSAGADLTAYRIIQEALTNVTKHATVSDAGVRLAYAGDRLDRHPHPHPDHLRNRRVRRPRATRRRQRGFLGKAASTDDLLAAIRTIASGDSLLSPQVTRALITRFLATPEPGSQLAHGDSLAGLTAREQEIMALAAQGYSNDDIAAKLFLSTHTVRTHIQRAMVYRRSCRSYSSVIQ
jgi:DNA-binding CsgD family transcriptional regulator